MNLNERKLVLCILSSVLISLLGTVPWIHVGINSPIIYYIISILITLTLSIVGGCIIVYRIILDEVDRVKFGGFINFLKIMLEGIKNLINIK
mgnify:FL=1